MIGNNFDELLSATNEEAAVIESQRLKILADIGEKVLSEVRGKPEFTDLLVKFGEAEAKAAEIQRRMARLRAEKTAFERAEKERIAKYTCPACRKFNGDGASFCEECGHKIGELPREFCKTCCFTNQPGMKFCGECGTKLAEIQGY